MSETDEQEGEKRCRRKRRRVKVREAKGRGAQPKFDYEVPPLVKYSRWAMITLGVLVLLVGASFGLHFYLIKSAEANDVTFDAELWRKSGREEIYRNNVPKDTRVKMYRDLVERDLLFGLKRDEVAALLGEPDNYPYFRRMWRDCNYWVGPKRGLNRWGSIWLGVRFDKLGRVTETAVLESGVFWN